MKINPSWSFAAVLAFEALLSIVNFAAFPSLTVLTSAAGNLIPTIFYLKNEGRDDVAAFVLLTYLLLPVKVYFGYLLISSLSLHDKSLLVAFPSSDSTLSKRVISTASVLLLTVLMGSYVLTYADPTYFATSDPPRSAIAKYEFVRAGGLQMWWGWSMMHLSIFSLLMSLLIVFAAEWFRQPSKIKESES